MPCKQDNLKGMAPRSALWGTVTDINHAMWTTALKHMGAIRQVFIMGTWCSRCTMHLELYCLMFILKISAAHWTHELGSLDAPVYHDNVLMIMTIAVYSYSHQRVSFGDQLYWTVKQYTMVSKSETGTVVYILLLFWS